MINFHKEMFDFYKEHVKLNQQQRALLADYREKNIERLKYGLASLGYPQPMNTVNQGSYAMYTTNQHPGNNYDIDIAVIFKADGLPASAYDSRKRIESAMVVSRGNFSKQPEARTNAVTVWYKEGYHVDLAIHRLKETNWGEKIIEHAGVDWQERDPNEITNWFAEEVRRKSPTSSNDGSVPKYQMRRIVQLIKFFTKSRESWNLPGGLIISVLVNECYVPHQFSDEESLLRTLDSIYNRLKISTEIYNPVYKDQALTYKEEYQWQVNRLKDILEKALLYLEPLYSNEIDKEISASVWNKFFNHPYWENLILQIQEAKKTGESLRRGSFVSAEGYVSSNKTSDISVKIPHHKYYGK
jgi:hypothetical protein